MDTQSTFFDDSAPCGVLKEFQAEGFRSPVVGIIYDSPLPSSGVPLGALGTGFIEFRPDGTLGQCSILNDFVPPRELSTAFLAVEAGGERRDLQTGPGGAAAVRYWGHYPFADVAFELDMPIAIAVRAFSPFIPGDKDSSNIPAAVFMVRVTNDSGRLLQAKLELSFPGSGAESRAERMTSALHGVSMADGRGYGYAVGAVPAPGVTIGAQDSLPDSPGPSKVTADFSLATGETAEVTFILAWFYPYFKDSDWKVRRHRYCVRFGSASEVAEFTARRLGDLLRRSLAWQQVIYETDLPPWLKDALVNALYSLPKNSIWIYDDDPDSWYPSHEIFAHSESFTGCPITETMVCRFHGHFPMLMLFPELERTTLEGFRHYQLGSGEIPFSFGTPNGLDRPHYRCQHPLNSAEYVQLVHRYIGRTGDEEDLKHFYPSVKAAIEFAKTLDTDGDCLVNEHPHPLPGESWPANQFYDIWPWRGTSAYVAGIWLASLLSAAEMATRAGDPDFARLCRDWFERGRQTFDSKLWNGRYYALWSDPDGGVSSEICLANQLMGDWCSRVLGVGRLLPEERVHGALDSVVRLNMGATRWGAVNGCLPDGSIDEADGDHARHIFVGECYCTAMTMMYEGRMEAGLELAKRLAHSLAIASLSPWNQHCLISSADGTPVWGSDYYSDMAVWAVPMALSGQGVASFAASGGLLDRIICAADSNG